MQEWIIAHQLAGRFCLFLLVFGLFAWWETVDTWRQWLTSRKIRWIRHISLSFISKLTIKLLFPTLAVGMAVHVQSKGIGILNQISLPIIIKIILGILAMDFVIYVQHRMLHNIPLLWKIHRVHHSDKHLDVSTGLRFHPLEEVLSMGAKMIGIGFFGVPYLAVFIFEILLNTAALFTHVNVRANWKNEMKWRNFIVTPSMHRIHHSDIAHEMNSNYGFCLSWWDKLWGTYTPYAHAGERKLFIGLEEFSDPKFQTLENMLLLPFGFKHLRVRHKKMRKLQMDV